MTDPTISLGVQSPQFASPVDQVTKALALKDMIQQQALRQAQTTDFQAQAQQRQKEYSDKNTIQQSFLQHKDDGDQMWSNVFNDVQGKVDPAVLTNLQEAHNKTVTEGLNLSAAQRKDHKDILGTVDDALTGLSGLDEDQKATEYTNMLHRLSTDPVVGPKIQTLVSSGAVPQHYDPQAIQAIHAQVVGQAGLLAEEEKRQTATKSKADAAKANQDVTNLQAALPGVQAEAEQKVSHAPVAKAIDAATLANPGLLTPEQAIQQANAEKQQHTAAGHLAVAQQELQLHRALQEAEIGPGSAQTWVDVLKSNPDASDKIPEKLRNQTAQLFTQQTGLPFPKPAPATSTATELAGRNALDNSQFILKAIQNPEIQKRLGTVLGRLGQFEQNLGTATAGLSPEASQLAQELRTRMRYFVFQEGKSVLGGRLPQNLMNQLEQSSADVHMDEPTLKGAIAGARGTALANMDNVDKERFGGSARPRVLRGLPPGEIKPNPNGKGRIASDDGGKTVYDPDTGQVIPRE